MKIGLASLSSAALVSIFAASAIAQPPDPPAPAPFQRHMRPGGPGLSPEDRLERRLTARLGLNADQQNRVHSALAQNRVLSQGMFEKTRTLQTSLDTAIKNGDESSIDSITRDLANLHQQTLANRAKTTARIYSALTPDQKALVGDRLQMLSGGPGGPGLGRGFGPPPGAPRVRRLPQ